MMTGLLCASPQCLVGPAAFVEPRQTCSSMCLSLQCILLRVAVAVPNAIYVASVYLLLALDACCAACPCY